MEKNFKVEQAIYLKVEDFSYDLHNHYELVSIELNINEGKSVKLYFKKSKGKWVPSDIPEIIVLAFLELNYIVFSKELFVKNCVNIEEIGYKELGNEVLDYLLSESNFTSNCDLIIRFDDDEYIRLNAKVGKLELITSLP